MCASKLNFIYFILKIVARDYMKNKENVYTCIYK